MSLDRETFLKLAAAIPTEAVEVPGGVVLVRGLTGAEWDEYETQNTRAEGDRSTFVPRRAHLVRLAAVGDDGKPLFTAADEPAIAAAGAAFVNPIVGAAMRLSGATRKAADAAGKD